jgi:selenocysteine lyase/cysteine desulfurase
MSDLPEKYPLAKYIGNADEFPVLRAWQFFNHAGASPLPRVVANAIRQYVDETEAAAYLIGDRYAELDVIRGVAAKFINADADEIALLKNTAEGLSIVAHAVDWRPGDRIVTAAGEYPANVYPWMEMCATRGTELVFVPEAVAADGTRSVPLDAVLREAAHPRTRLVTLSHVEFATGQRHDGAAIGRFCREHGKIFVVDAIQSLGALSVDVKAMQCDYLASGGQKWMLAAEGAAIFYCRRELLERTRPLVVGAVSVKDFMAFDRYDYTLAPTARRFESGTYNIAGFKALRAAMELLGGVGIESVARRIKHLTDHFIAGVTAKGYRIASPRTGEQWSGIVSFASPAHDHVAVAKMLLEKHKTELRVRGGRLRLAPHFYNTEEQIDRLVEHLPGH